MELSRLPIGEDAYGEQVCVNLTGGRAALLNGNPGSGKSVCLSVLCCDILRCSNVRLAIMSPKILDFVSFADSALLVMADDDTPNAYVEYLDYLHEESERRKKYCIDNKIKKIEPSPEVPQIVTIIDEYTVLKLSEKKIEEAVMKLVAEARFAAFSFVIATQRVSSKNMSTDLRDLLGGNRIGFASETEETDKMIFGDLYKDAPCYRIGADLKGVGYISTDSQKPVLFKGYFANEYDELNAAANTNNESWGAIRDEIFNK